MSHQLSVKGRPVGVLEYWSDGLIPVLQYSITPSLQVFGIHT
jgi:hypothetical protein